MANVSKTAATGTIDAAHLLDELNAAASSTGSRCTSVHVLPGNPNDTIELIFDQAPNDAALDSVIAASPTHPIGLAASADLLSNGDFVRVWSTLVAPGERVEVDAEIIVTPGDATDLEPGTVHFHGMARRRTGESVHVTNRGTGGLEVYGELPGLTAKLEAVDASQIDLMISARRSVTAAIDGRVTANRKVLS